MEEIKKNKDVECVYVDGITLSQSEYDFTVYGLRTVRTFKPDGSVSDEHNEVVNEMHMSPRLAKAFLKLFSDGIQAYENNNGKISQD